MSRVTVIPTLLDILPFHQVFNWERFQILCTDLLFKRFNVIDSRDYLAKGNAQNGIDVYSIQRGEEKISVAQCKLVEYLGPKQVLDIVDEFLRGELADYTKEFILCTSANLKRQRDEEITISEARRKLSTFGIDLIVWDADGLSLQLRTNPAPEIVYHYFGGNVTLAFYGELWKSYVKKLQRVKKREYKIPLDYIERKIISYTDNINNKKKNTWNYWEMNAGESLIKLLETIGNKEYKKIVLLSTAGYGKTEEINNVAGYFSSEEKLAYPIKFYLRDYEGQTIETILFNYDLEWRNIREDDLLLLFDGLDEISEKYFQTFINHLNAFVVLNPKASIVVSSRYNFYEISHTPQLRDFEIFLLHPLTSQDVEEYMYKNLDSRTDEFKQLIHAQKFSDYLQNPYYLTRLVRFYNDTNLPFPKSTSELFERILFERLEKDKEIYKIPNLKEKLFPIASEIAFCMTIAGKSALTDEEMNILIADSKTKKLLNHFSILNRNSTIQGSWSFEHKNLQEYLCSLIFTTSTFSEIHSIISFEHDNKKLLPRFLNTISFLFEILDKDTKLFKELLHWINENEPEILIRFEKEKLLKEKRQAIFYKIFQYYKQQQLTIRVSTNFSYEELAAFTEIDENIIEFLNDEFSSEITSTLAYDALSILSNCKKPFLYNDKLKSLLFKILANRHYADYVHAKVITTFIIFQFTGRIIFEKIIASATDLGNKEIRQACILFLNNTEYYEEFSKFILDSINIIQQALKNENNVGSYIVLKQVLLKFHSPAIIKQLFQYCIINKNWINKYAHYKEFHFELKEIIILLEKAKATYDVDKSILPIVYRLFCRLEYISLYPDWFQPFNIFFKSTCGTQIIFERFYKHGKKYRNLMSFADLECCNFLIEEYKNKKIDENELRGYRNTLSHINYGLFLIFYENLKLLNNGAFVIEDINVDYNKIRTEQKNKNQLMLLNRKLFLQEARQIFKIIGKEKITANDLWSSENNDLRKFDASIVIEAIRNSCIDNEAKLISKSNFLKSYKDDAKWEGFVIESIVSLMKEKELLLNPELQLKINQWCKSQIQTLSFENSIIDVGDSYKYFDDIEFVKEVFLLLDLNLEDDDYLKLLPSDYESFYMWNQDDKNTIASVIIHKTINKEVLKKTVLDNIKNENLAVLVLCSHFSICHKMQYRECLPYLYQTITSHILLTPHNKIKLTEYYLDLGGTVSDFITFLKIPVINKEEEIYTSWEWFLIEKMAVIDSTRVSGILLQILGDPNQSLNKLKAAQHLIELGKIKGLEYWATYVKEKKVFPFEHKWSSFQRNIIDLPSLQAIKIFLSVLDFYYKNNLQNLFKGSLLIDESVFNSLITIATLDYEYYKHIKSELQKIQNDFAETSIADSINYFSERLTQKYYESQKQEIDIKSARLIFSSIFSKS